MHPLIRRYSTATRSHVIHPFRPNRFLFFLSLLLAIVIFSKPINPAMFNTSTFIVSAGVQGTVEYREETSTAIFLPSPPLTRSTRYSVTVTRGVQDLEGKSLPQEKKWSFKTAATFDRVPPIVIESTPPDRATDVTVTADVTVKFNEDIDSLTLSSKFVLTGPEGNVATDFIYNAGNRIATVRPVAPLKDGTRYQVTLKKGVRDLSKNAMTSDTKWEFTTAGFVDLTPPTIESHQPEGSRVSVRSVIKVRFSESMSPGAVVKENFTLSRGGGLVSGLVEYDQASRTATFQPSGSRLDYRSTYTALLSEKVKDLAGNALAADLSAPRSWTWTTIAPPEVIARSPDSGIASADASFQVTFSRAMRQESINPESFHLVRLAGGERIPGMVAYLYAPDRPTDPTGATYIPSARLTPGTVYQLILTPSSEDNEGNPLGSSMKWSDIILPTGPSPDLTPPEIVEIRPPENAFGVSIHPSIEVVFSEPVNPATLNSQTFLIEGSPIGEWHNNEESRTARLTPLFPLAYSNRYIVRLTRGIQDRAGNPLAGERVWFFVTEADPNHLIRR